MCMCAGRLQYFARGVQVYIKQLRAALQGKSGDALRTDEVCVAVCLCIYISVSVSVFVPVLVCSCP